MKIFDIFKTFVQFLTVKTFLLNTCRLLETKQLLQCLLKVSAEVSGNINIKFGNFETAPTTFFEKFSRKSGKCK